MNLSTWSDLLTSLFDSNGHSGVEVPGPSIREWLLVIQQDYDEVDQEHYLDTIGGE